MEERIRFEALQSKYRQASDAEKDLRRQLEAKYSSVAYATRTETAKLDAIRARSSKAGERILAWLDANSPRDWHYNAPYWWVCSELSFEDAITRGPLAKLPPLSYGQTRTPAGFLESVA